MELIKKLFLKMTSLDLLFFYNLFGDNMKLYLDVIFFLNFGFDFLLLSTVSIVLKRNVKFIKIILGGVIGGLSIFILFFKINSVQLFLLKFIISLIMVIVTFSYKNFQYTIKNIEYLYMVSIVLGGFLYLINNEFSYKNDGLVFYHNGLSINFIVLIILSPFILYTYIKQLKRNKNYYQYCYKVKICIDGKEYNLNGFLDTGNKLVDPYFKKPIIVLNKGVIETKANCILVPINTVNKTDFISCFKADKIEVENKVVNAIIGISNEKFEMEGIDVLLQTRILEG